MIIDHIENKNVTTFISGMAQGIDMWGARLVLKLKDTYPNLKLVCAIPCKNHTDVWDDNHSVNEWFEITQSADEVIYVSEEEYSNKCMQERNEWMVDNSDYVIAVWKGSIGGTSNCIKYAIEQGKEVTRLHPFKLEIQKLDW